MDSNAVVHILSMMGWTRIFEAVDPSPEAKPSLDPWPHSPLMNLRICEFARVSPQEGTLRFTMASNKKLSTIDSELKSLQDKHVKLLVCLAMPGLEQSIIRLSSETEDSVRGYAEQAQSLLKVQSL